MRKSKEKGKSHSTRPVKTEADKWVKYPPNEIESLVIELARKGLGPSMIGIRLRDQYGIPSVKELTGKGISHILKEKGLSPILPEDLQNMIQRAQRIHTHLEAHPKDMFSKRGLMLLESRIYRLVKYYKREGILPADWKYSAALFTPK
ncbi:MAG: 30S ribosomal protein S15 [Candidatus Methanomethylicia archaeon]